MRPSPTFTHDGPGTPAGAWREHATWRTGKAVILDGVGRLVVVAAHPDDESLGAGGLVATARRVGIAVDVVCVTDGEGSHPSSPTITPAELAARRRAESLSAAQALGVVGAHVHHLGHPDGRVSEHVQEVTTAVVDLVGDGDGCVLVAPWRRDGHPDHEAVGRAAATAAHRTDAELWEFPVWFWHHADPGDANADLRPFLLDERAASAKAEALLAHATQVGPLSDHPGDEVLLGPAILEHFRSPVEHFVVTPGWQCPDKALDDLHAREADPWGVETRWYERRKRDLLLAMLPRERFRHALEVGCSIGLLADALARRCDHLVAVDSSVAAVTAATERLAGRSSVDVRHLRVPHEWPDDGLRDLVVVSEVGYFLSPGELAGLVDRVRTTLAPGGVLVLCHWRHPVEGWVLDVDAVHAAFEAEGVPPVQATYRDRDVELRVHAPDTTWPDPQA